MVLYDHASVRYTGISDKDTADIGGDIFFWLKDRILHPMHCRRNPTWGQCASAPLLYEDNVCTSGSGPG